MVCSFAETHVAHVSKFEAHVAEFKEAFTGALNIDLVVLSGSLETAEVLRQVSDRIRYVLVRRWI